MNIKTRRWFNGIDKIATKQCWYEETKKHHNEGYQQKSMGSFESIDNNFSAFEISGWPLILIFVVIAKTLEFATEGLQ